MPDRITFGMFADKLLGAVSIAEESLYKGLVKATVQVHKTAIKKFGEYQPEIGDFPGWAALNPQYVLTKLHAGAAHDDPLIGHYVGKAHNDVYPVPLRQSIAMDVSRIKLVGQVGTNDPLGEYHEFGTEYIPPRPFLRPALYQNREWIKRTMRESMTMGMAKWFR